jgi:hypothetical protein
MKEMKKELENLESKLIHDVAKKTMSRKEAIKKTGFMAVSAATMMLLLSNPAQANGSGGHGHSGRGGHGGGPGGSCDSHHQEVDQTPKKNDNKDNGIWK